MNPFLEQNDTWEDFHGRFVPAIADRLERLVGEHYVVKIEVRLYLHELSAEERRYFAKADVGVVKAPVNVAIASPSATLTTAPLPLTLPAVEVERHASVEIRDRRNRRVVTVIELLSPTNKTPGPDHMDYLAKRSQLLAGRTHFVEIEMRRGGERPRLPDLPTCDYYVLVSRAEDRPKLGMWPVSLHDQLPAIPIPLSAPDHDVLLDLQELLHAVYDAANYGKYIYGETPDPPLRPDDAEWARQFLPR